ncbi:accessory factor UbiK family protein [Cellvibrio sp. PSBB006]|uniref:accessory factor UbiK family protein n=1 Tax=Cellvibrio sp. PSBB006 TaxID=1987723 RepID=UPI000B3B65E5|nr:accessory factor UbiK family protein [Cellvibrio sp. PSBB006]
MITDFAQRLLQELQKNLPQISALLPKRELHLALQSALSRLDLVTREEFDAQQAVLARTREKLEQLEETLASLEARASDKP